MGDSVVYKTAPKAASVVAFYQQEMAAGGWKQSGEPTSKDGVVTVEFTKDGLKASVIAIGSQVSQVMVSVRKE